MKAKIILLALLSTVAAEAQELSAQAKERMQKMHKTQDPKILEDPQKIFDTGYWTSYSGNNTLGEEMMQYAFRNIKNLEPETIRHSSVQNTKNGFWPQAVEKLERSSALDPGINNYYGWVMLFFYRDYERSLACFEKYEKHMKYAESLNANADNLHYLKGIANMQLGNLPKAIHEFELCEAEYLKFSKKPNFHPFQLMLYKGRCYQKLADYDKALLCYDKANKIAQMADNYFYKAQVLLSLNKKPEAKQAFEQALQLVKSNRKHQDGYQEVFDEVYWQDVQAALDALK